MPKPVADSREGAVLQIIGGWTGSYQHLTVKLQYYEKEGLGLGWILWYDLSNYIYER